MPKIESEKIDCLHRPCSRPAPRGKTESVRTHSEVIEQFHSFLLLKLLFLVRNWHCWSRKAFPRQMMPKAKKKCENGRFWTSLTGMKSYMVDRGWTPAPKDATKLAVFFRFFFSLSFDNFDNSVKNSVQRWSSHFQGLFRVKIRKMAQGSNDLSTLALTKNSLLVTKNSLARSLRKNGSPNQLKKLRRRDIITKRKKAWYIECGWSSREGEIVRR